jgi:hypothetical protein
MKFCDNKFHVCHQHEHISDAGEFEMSWVLLLPCIVKLGW